MTSSGACEGPLVSIVIPAFNAQETIGATLACVRAQTYGSWELTVVDNDSSDDTRRLVERAAAADPRIHVLPLPENRGVAGGRNAGLELARGDYLFTADADDSFRPDLLERAVRAAQEIPGGADAVIFGYVERYFDRSGRHLYDHRLVPSCPGTYVAPDAWHRLVPVLERGTFYGYSWNKLWNLDRIRRENLRFEDVRLIEDVVFSCAFFQNASSLVVLGDAPYLYAKVDGKSVTNANDYSARTYWDLHERRISLLRDQQESWGTLDDESLSILGSLYARFVVSAMERTYHPDETWTRFERLSWCEQIFSTSLFKEVIPQARAESSHALALAIAAMRRRDARALVAIGRLAHLARSGAYGTFTAIRSKR